MNTIGEFKVEGLTLQIVMKSPPNDAAEQLAAAAERMLNNTGGMSLWEAEGILRNALKAYREAAK